MTSPWSNPPQIENEPPKQSSARAMSFVHPLDYDRLLSYLVKVIDHIPSHVPHNPEVSKAVKHNQPNILACFEPDASVPLGMLRTYPTRSAFEIGEGYVENPINKVWAGFNGDGHGLCTDAVIMVQALLHHADHPFELISA